jgi:triphosphatase
LQLRLSKLLITKPWRKGKKQYEQNIQQHASGQLELLWQRVFNLKNSENLTAQTYLQSYDLLDQALLADRLLGNAFPTAKRDAFSAPWQDIFEGMQELRTLNVLQSKLQDSDMDDKTELLQWNEVKRSTILTVIKQSTVVALEVEPYW